MGPNEPEVNGVRTPIVKFVRYGKKPFCRLLIRSHADAAVARAAAAGPDMRRMSGHYRDALRGTSKSFLPTHEVLSTIHGPRPDAEALRSA